MKFLWILFITGCLIIHTAYSQVKIGDNVSTINSNSLLELETTNKGLVLPRVSLTDVSLPNPMATGLLTGTIVYNTNSSVSGGFGAGIYMWNGTAWAMLATPATTNTSAWNVSGNVATPGNFLGTTNNSALRFRTNNIQHLMLDSLGSLGLGSSSFGNLAGREKLLIDAGNTSSNTIANFRGSIDGYLQFNLRNTSNGTNASTDFVATADNGTDSTFYIDMGINSSTYTPSVDNFGAANDGYLYTNSRNLLIGTQSSGSDLIFMVSGGSIRNNQAMRISGANGNLIMGRGDNTTTPFGNIIRAANALPAAVNTAGGSLVLIGGKSTGTAAGGDVSLTGGTTVSGPPGAVNINVGTNNSTNINTGANTGNITLGNPTNNIILPKFSTPGSVFYNGSSSGLLSAATSLAWDETNVRLGVGTTTPGSELDVVGTVRLSGTTSGYVGLKGAAAAGATTYTLPAADGSAGQQLTTNGAGALSWTNQSGATTNTLSLATNTLTSTVNGVAATSSAVSSVSNTSSVNTLTTRVNNVAATGVTIINSNASSLSGSTLTNTVNGVASAALDLTPAITSKAWSLTGNTGTSSATNFLGTTDAQALVLKSNNTQVANFNGSTGGVAIGPGAVAGGANSTAIGYNSRTTQANTVILGDSVNTSVGIGTTVPNPGVKLDVSGTFDLGAQGTVIKNIINVTSAVNVSVPSSPGIADVTITLPLTLGSTRATVTASPSFDFPGKISIGYARIITTSTMKIRFVNPSSTATVTGDLYFTIVEY